MAELTDEALSEIDKDIVASLEKCGLAAIRLSEHEEPDHLTAALETCFLALKVHHAFEEHIDGNGERQEARNQVAEISKLYLELSGNTEVLDTLVYLYRKNSGLVESNSSLLCQIVRALEAVDQSELDSMTKSIQGALAERVKTSFNYEGIIDPRALGAVVDEMQDSIHAIETNITESNELYGSTQQKADFAVNTHQTVQTLLTEMKTNVEEVRDDLFTTRHFACDMIDEAVIGGFYSRELRPIALNTRQYIVGHIGEEQVTAILTEGDDRYLTGRAEAVIAKSDLLRLQAQRERVDGHLSDSSGWIQEVNQHLSNAGQVPQRNADQFRSSASTFHVLSYCPLFGFIFALMFLKKVKAFAAAFESGHQIYEDLGTEMIVKTEKLRKLNAKLVINYPASMVLAQAAKQLGSYIGSSGPSQ